MVRSIEIEGYKYQISTKKTDFSCTKITLEDFVKNKKVTLYLSAPFSLVMDYYEQIGRDVIEILKLPYWSLRITGVVLLKDFKFTYMID